MNTQTVLTTKTAQELAARQRLLELDRIYAEQDRRHG